MKKNITILVSAIALMLVACQTPPTPSTSTSTSTSSSSTTTTSSTTSSTTTTTTVVPQMPTEFTTGPTISDPPHLGVIEVYNGDNITLDNVIVDRLVIWPGGKVTASNVRIEGAIVVIPQVGQPMIKLHLFDSSSPNAMTVNVLDAQGYTLDWENEVPVDIIVSGSWLHHPQGDGSFHTEALAGFGWPQGAQFLGTTFVQEGPYNGTATATINWHGTDSLFENNYFVWENGTAAYYTIYVEGRNNLVRNNQLEIGLADYIYPESSPEATYEGNTDIKTGAPIIF